MVLVQGVTHGNGIYISNSNILIHQHYVIRDNIVECSVHQNSKSNLFIYTYHDNPQKIEIYNNTFKNCRTNSIKIDQR